MDDETLIDHIVNALGNPNFNVEAEGCPPSAIVSIKEVYTR